MWMLSGLMSRWMKPALWTRSRPSRIGRRMRSSSSSGSVPRRSSSAASVDALLEAHHHVRGVVELEHRVHADDAGVVEPRERARFLDEALEPPAVSVPEPFGARPDRRVGHARGELDGQVFLDRDALVEIGVAREIGDAESALAQDPLDHIPVQPRLRRQPVGIGGVGHGGTRPIAVICRERKGSATARQARAARRRDHEPRHRATPSRGLQCVPFAARCAVRRMRSRRWHLPRETVAEKRTVSRRYAPGTARRSRACSCRVP